MRRKTRLAAAAMAAFMVFSVVGPAAVAAADNTTNQTATPTATATVTATETPANETATETETEDANETETETETADANETVDGNATENGSANASDGAFGQFVSDFVHGMLGNQTNSSQPLGWFVSEYVTVNNPGADKRPDQAGPKNASERGPPWAQAGSTENDSDDQRGPSGHAGPKDTSEKDSGRPPWAGGPDAGMFETSGTSTDNATNGTATPAPTPDERGPPDHAGPGGNGR